MKRGIIIAMSCFSFAAKAQKIEAISFNLYTDSLKKGVYNYINVDGKCSNGKFLPLMSDEVEFTSSFGKWEGNSLVIDSSARIDSVIISASLKSDARIKKAVTVYVKKKEENILLPTEQELLEKWKKKKN